VADNLWSFSIAMLVMAAEAALMLRGTRLRCAVLMVAFVAALTGCSAQDRSAQGTDRPFRFALPETDRFLSGSPR
jgi:hypothetical protein